MVMDVLMSVEMTMVVTLVVLLVVLGVCPPPPPPSPPPLPPPTPCCISLQILKKAAVISLLVISLTVSPSQTYGGLVVVTV